MPRKEPYKPKGKGKKTTIGTRAWLTKHQDGRTKLDPEKMSRYQIVGKTPSGKLKLEIIINPYGFYEGVGKVNIEVSEEDWNKRFVIGKPKGVSDVKRKRKAAVGGEVRDVLGLRMVVGGDMRGVGGVVVNPKGVGRGSGEKKKKGKAAAKIQRAVRRRQLRKSKKKRAKIAEEVAKEEKFAPELRAELGKTKKLPIGFNVEVVGTGQDVFEPVSKPVKVWRKVPQEKGGGIGPELVYEEDVISGRKAEYEGRAKQPAVYKDITFRPARPGLGEPRDDRYFGKGYSTEEKRRIATARVGNRQLVIVDGDELGVGGTGYSGITRGKWRGQGYFIRDGWGKGLHKLVDGYSNWVWNKVVLLPDHSASGIFALTEAKLREEVNRRARGETPTDNPRFFRNLLRADRLHGFASTYNYHKASKDWRERGGSNI